jgi:UDP-N-acetylglucosamine--N-acetylmuramyl-(pentapeptide) pyrophosphoryl-undecaprenol N-acetylglucosamine transferase
VSEKILIAGGGTGGHVFPGLAVADALRALADVEVIFVGTARGIETRVIPDRGYTLELLDVTPLKGGGPARAVRGALTAARATLTSVALLRRLRPRAVLSVGGYAAGPISLAAAALGIPMAILEPNATVGLANRWLAPFAKRAYLAWPEAGKSLRSQIVRLTGVPLRAGFAPSPYCASSSARVLVMGGSQGAEALNVRLPEAIALVAKELSHVEVVHQAGRDRDGPVREAYARERVVKSSVVPFLEDVAGEIAKCDLVVARAGAGTLAEIAAIGRAAVFVPFPHAADDHQATNAASFVSAGAAVSVRQEAADAVRIASELVRLLADGATREKMANAMRARGKPDAARVIAKDLLSLAGIACTVQSFPSPSRTNGHKPSTPFSEMN